MAHIISVGGPNSIGATNPFTTSSVFRTQSLCVTPVEFLDGNGVDSGKLGTGFFWRHEGKTFLITNWHNVSGKNPFDFELLDPTTAFVPAKFQIFLPRAVGNESSFAPLGRVAHEVTLYADFNEPLWLEHPEFERLRVDVVAIPLDGVNLSAEFHVNAHQSLELFNLVGADVFVVGYPFKNYTGIALPIWKRGSFATEPIWPIDGKPMFLIDAATRPGMSGAPIFRHQLGPATTVDRTIHAGNIVTTQFIGVYSGHIGDSLQQLGIGFGWYGSLVDEIIHSSKLGGRH